MAEERRSVESKPPAAPRWVKVLAIITAIVVAVVLLVAIFGGGRHGPSRHSLGGDHRPGQTLSDRPAL